jgi:hypothetical protein
MRLLCVQVEHSNAVEGETYYVRSLGYVGSFIKQFQAIEDLLQPDCTAADLALVRQCCN